MTPAGLEVAEGVDPARRGPAVDFGALLGQEAARVAVALRPCEVDLAMRGIEVAHHEDAASSLSKGLQPVEEGSMEIELVGHSAVVALGAAPFREVDVCDPEPSEASELDASLSIESVLAEARLDGVRLSPGIQPDPAVPRPLGVDEVRVPAAGCADAVGKLVFTRAHLLEADDFGSRPR